MNNIEKLNSTRNHKYLVLEIHYNNKNAAGAALCEMQIEELEMQIAEALRYAARYKERDEEAAREADERETLRQLRRQMGPLGGGI